MGVSMTEWLKALQHWQNSGHTSLPRAALFLLAVWAVIGVIVALFGVLAWRVGSLTLGVMDRYALFICLVACPFLLGGAFYSLPLDNVHTWENPPSGFQTQVEKAYNVQILGSDTSVGGSTVRLAKNPVKLDSDTLNATVKDMRQANMPSDGTYNLDYTDKDGRLHHGTLAVKNTTINLYDETGKPVNPVKGLK